MYRTPHVCEAKQLNTLDMMWLHVPSVVASCCAVAASILGAKTNRRKIGQRNNYKLLPALYLLASLLTALTQFTRL